MNFVGISVERKRCWKYIFNMNYRKSQKTATGKPASSCNLHIEFRAKKRLNFMYTIYFFMPRENSQQ